MENLSRVETLLLPGDFLTNIELKGGYLSIPVHKSSRFIWQGKCYQFKALPFGLCSSPRIFTILLKTVAAFLRKKSIRVLLHLDDSLLFGSNKRGSNKKYSAFNNSLSVPRFYNKPRKSLVRFQHLEGVETQEGEHRFIVHGNFTPSGKSPQNSGLLPPPGNFLAPSYLACPTSFPPFTDGSN